MQKNSHRSDGSDTGSFFQKCSKKIRPTLDFDYTPFYCEENIWKLVNHPDFQNKQGWVVFISNPAKKCPMWHVKEAGGSNEPVIWDYHVVLMTCSPHWRVWDFDTRLGFPVSAGSYLNYSFRSEVLEDLKPYFKLVDIPFYRKSFSSDRQHMLGLKGEWMAKPPLWDPIQNETPSNLLQFIDVNSGFGGKVCNLSELRQELKL